MTEPAKGQRVVAVLEHTAPEGSRIITKGTKGYVTRVDGPEETGARFFVVLWDTMAGKGLRYVLSSQWDREMRAEGGRARTSLERRTLLNRLLAVWEASGDQRLGQVLVNYAPGLHPNPDLFYVEDETLIDKLEAATAHIVTHEPLGYRDGASDEIARRKRGE